MKAPGPALYVRFNMVDLNRQGKMYSQGMAPVYRILPGKPKWERINDKPVYTLQNDIFTLTFKTRTPENPLNTMYFAFTYPFSYVELDKMLVNIDQRYLNINPFSEDDIYYVRETISTIREPAGKVHTLPVPPKYNPQVFEDVGKSLGASILDLTAQNPCSRVPNSEFHSVLLLQGKAPYGVVKNRSSAVKKPLKPRGAAIPLDRKENLAQPGCSKSVNRLNKCFKAKSRKDLTLKNKNAAADKTGKSTKIKKVGNVVTTQKVRLDQTSKVGGTKLKKEADSIHLREICFIKNNEGKTVIAKYKNKEDK
ncbi:hypothetical protein NQ315_017288, partial [Exocentrus adspersus]